MSDNVDAMIEEQRRLAATRKMEYLRLATGQPKEDVMGFMTLLIYTHLMSRGYLDSFQGAEESWIPDLAEDIRKLVEQELIAALPPDRNGLAITILFATLLEVHWPDVADMIQSELQERRERMKQFAGTPDV